MNTHVANLLAHALTLAKQAPYLQNGRERELVRREYAEIYRALKAVDEYLREWKPVRSIKTTAE